LQLIKLFANKFTSKFGILGNYNKGKSTLINFFSDQEVEQGLTMHTRGINIIHSRIEACPITYFDAPGRGEPVSIVNKKIKNYN
jgi:ribosome biogenesis GTPase A